MASIILSMSDNDTGNQRLLRVEDTHLTNIEAVDAFNAAANIIREAYVHAVTGPR